HDAALAGLCAVYQKAQQWPDLAEALLSRANVAPSPTVVRNLLADAADIFEHRLSEPSRARELYQKILDEDPTHAGAGEGLQRILEGARDFSSLVKMLEHRAEILRGEKRWGTLARIAELFEDQLDD